MNKYINMPQVSHQDLDGAKDKTELSVLLREIAKGNVDLNLLLLLVYLMQETDYKDALKQVSQMSPINVKLAVDALQNIREYGEPHPMIGPPL